MTRMAANMSTSRKEILASQKLLQNQCEKTWLEINQVHNDLAKEKPHGTLSATGNHMLEVCRAKEKQLSGELNVLKNTPLEVYPNDANTLQVLLQDELETSNAQLQQTLDVVQTQRKELEEELNRESISLQQHKDVHQSLVRKLEEAKQRTSEQHDGDRDLKNLTRKRQRAVEMQQELMRNLAHFATEHFPLPSNADIGKASKRKKSLAESDEELHHYISILEILEVLMNKCTDEDQDPYITLDESFWPPYVELLLRCGIALRHPQSCQRIKLVPFNL